MKSKRRRIESLSKSLDSVFERMNAQVYVHQIQASNPLPALPHSVLYPSPAYTYPEYTYPAYIPAPHHTHTNNLHNSRYHPIAPEYQYNDSYTSPGLLSVPPIQALEAQVLNCCRNCSQTFTHMHDTDTNVLKSLSPQENIAQNNSMYFFEKCQPSNTAAIEPVLLNNVFRVKMETKRSQDTDSNIKEVRSKFFRPFEDE